MCFLAIFKYVNSRCLYPKWSTCKIVTIRSVMDMIDKNIKHFRKAKGMSQEEMAVKLNVVRQTVSKWENGGSLR